MRSAKLAFTPVIPVLSLLFCSVSTSARAQGYGLYEQGACTMGRGGAGVAAPCDDGSAVFFNPAGLALDPAVVLSAGGTAIAPRGGFTDSTTQLVSTMNDRTFFVPTAYAAGPIGQRAVVGVGLFAPYGLTTDWPATSEGRFLGYKSTVQSIYVQPTVAFKLTGKVFVGGGLDISHTSLELRRRVDLAGVQVPGAPAGVTFAAIGIPRGTDFADVDLTGSGTHVGAHVGVIVKANDRVSVGGRFLTRQTADITNGTVATAQVPTNLTLSVPLPGLPAGTLIDAIVAAAFAPGQTLSNQTAATSVPMPDQLVIGVAIRATTRVKVLADYQYTHWSLFDQVVIQNQNAAPTTLVESYQDTHGIRFGVEYALANRIIVRGGFDGHTAAAPDQSVTPVLPEAARREFTAGATVPIASHLRIDLAYQYIGQTDRDGRTTDAGMAVPTVAANNGRYHYHANLFGASVVVRF